MFLFDVDQPQVVYTAEDVGCGIISRVDLRTNIVEKVFTTDFFHPDTSKPLDTMNSVKALAQNAVLGGSQLLVGGSKSFTIGLVDLRCLPPIPADWEEMDEGSVYRGNPFVKMWSPEFTTEKDNDNNSKVTKDIMKHNSSYRKSNARASISGLSFSSDGSSILASYQGDQIYTFNTYSKNGGDDFEYKKVFKITTYAEALVLHAKELEDQSKESEIEKKIRLESIDNMKKKDKNREQNMKSGPLNLYGGHINHATFLKAVSFFGPRDEYIVSGSDTGHLWVWDSSSGSLDLDEPEDRTCRVVNFLKAGNFDSYIILFCIIVCFFSLFYFILFYFIFLYFILFHFILFYFILFYFILFYFILFYLILFYLILFYFISFYFISF